MRRAATPSLLLLPLCAAAEDPAQAALKAALQRELDALPLQQGTALQLGWKSATMEFAIAAGTYNQTGPHGEYPRAATTSDTYLFGSGSKAYTGAAVMNLAERGVLSLDDPVAKHVDPILPALRAGAACPACPATWAGMFPGANGSAVTIRHLLSMRSGIKDYDVPAFDNDLLVNRSADVVSPLDFIDYVARMPSQFDFAPGEHVSYSSTNFIIAGLVLTAHAGVGGDWARMRSGSFFPAAVSGDVAHTHYFTDEPFSAYLTGPGLDATGTVVYAQNSSIMGYTCSNVVATALDVAKWFWDVVGPLPRVVTPSSAEIMTDFRPMDFGWMAGQFFYGVGLMAQGNLSKIGALVGHGGFVYGFSSYQGVITGLNASISFAANANNAAMFAVCDVTVAAAKQLGVIPESGVDVTCDGEPTTNVVYDFSLFKCAATPIGYMTMACEGGEFVERVFLDSACAGAVSASYSYPSGACIRAGVDKARFACSSDGGHANYSTFSNPYLTCAQPVDPTFWPPTPTQQRAGLPLVAWLGL